MQPKVQADPPKTCLLTPGNPAMNEFARRAQSAGTLRRVPQRILHRLLEEPPPVACFTRQIWYPWLIVGLVSIGAFIGQLDATIVQLALPTLGKTFDASMENVSWVSLAYLVAFASCLPIFGRLCEMFGRKSLYLAGYLLFVVASTLCGLASDLSWLIAFRVLQGIGGSLLGANSISILVRAVDEERRGRALGFFAAAQAIGMSAGPAIGGLVLGTLGWPWVFWITVPFGIAAAVIGWLVLPQIEAGARDQRFDWHGALLLGPALIFLVLVLNQVSVWGPASPVIVAFTVMSAVLIWLLVRQERASPSPLVDLRLFGSAAFSCGAIAVLLGYAMLYGMFFLMSFALEHGYGDSPLAAGLRLAVIPVALGIVAPFSGALSDRLGARLLSAAGMALCVVALLVLALEEADPNASRLFGSAAFALFGAGLGVFIAPNNHQTIKAAPASLSGEAGSMLNLMRALGTSLGVAGASSTLSWRLQATTGAHDSSGPFAGPALLGAVESSLAMLAGMAIAAGAVSLVRSKSPPESNGWWRSSAQRHEAVGRAACFHHADAGPRQVEADQRELLGTQTVEQPAAGGDRAVAVVIGAPAPVGPRERNRRMGQHIGADHQPFIAAFHEDRHVARRMPGRFQEADAGRDRVTVLAPLDLRIQPLEDARAAARHALEPVRDREMACSGSSQKSHSAAEIT